MAIYHFSGTVISRSQGRSAVACAAYRAGEKLYDERYDRMHDYTNKADVVHTEILLPENAPANLSDRERLWNTVEATEKRKDAQLVREFNFALPKELTLEQNIALAKDYVQQEFVAKGMMADLCIHNDKQPDGSFQPHAHVMLTLREVTENGFGQKVRDWNSKDQLLQWREQWAEVANRHLLLHDHDLRIDHRTLKAQGIELEPQHKIGPAAAPQTAERLAKVADHQRIARENGERLLENPSIALEAITRQQSTFTQQDIARFVNRHTENAEQFTQVFEKVKASPELVHLGQDERGQERYTSQAQLDLETRLMDQVQVLQQQDTHFVSAQTQEQVLKRYALSTEQETALTHLNGEGNIHCVIGYAGTGKSYLLGAAKETWEASGYQVHGAALAGIAAQNLQGSSGIESRTLQSYFYYWDKGERLLTQKDVLVVDEAGMIGSRQMARVMDEVTRSGAKLVLVGDPEQLQAIEAGAAFRAITQEVGYVELTEVRRQRDAWQQEATREFATGKTTEALERYASHDHVHAFQTAAEAQKNLVGLWNDARLSQPDKTQMMLAYTREQVKELNTAARQLRRDCGELGEDQVIHTERGQRTFAEQDRIYFLKNDRGLGVMNGTLGTIEKIEGHQLWVRVDADGQQPSHIVELDTSFYKDLEHGYAGTFHKAQGVTVDRSYVLASPYLDRHATYVGMTRHRESAELFYSKEHFAQEKALIQTLSRERAKDVTLDYARPPESLIPEKLPPLSEKAITQPEREKSKPELDLDALRAKYVDRQHDSLKAFAQRYKEMHGEKAKVLEEQTLPTHERLAKEAEQKVVDFQKSLKTRDVSLIESLDMGQYAETLVKEQPMVMAHLKSHEPNTANYLEQLAEGFDRQVKEMVKTMDRERDRGLGRELGQGKGLDEGIEMEL